MIPEKENKYGWYDVIDGIRNKVISSMGVPKEYLCGIQNHNISQFICEELANPVI
jgi:hypothetical protein